MSSDIINAEVIIIGSGIAGAMAAYSLAKKGIKVIILEAGPRIDRAAVVHKFTQSYKFDFSSGYPNEDWAPRPDWDATEKPYFEHIGPVQAKMEYLRLVGGTTWHWSGFTPRLRPEDMKLKSTYGVGIDWPFDYAELEPFYCLAEKEMGVAGNNNDPHLPPRSQPFPLPPIPHSYSDKIIAPALEKLGIALSSPPAARNSHAYDGRSQCMGFGTCSPICPSGAQYSASVHVGKAEKLGVHVLENTRVDRVVADAAGNIKEVIAHKPDGSEVIARGSIFLLAANGIESPKLLLMSADEHHTKGLANSSGHVGRYFFEHPSMVCRLIMPVPVYPRGPEVTMGSNTFCHGDFRKKHTGYSFGIHNFPHHHEATDYLLAKGAVPPELDSAIRDRVSRMIDMNTQMEQLPREENGITLDWTRKDRAGQPMVKHYYSYTDYERAGFDHARKTFTNIATALNAELLSIDEPVVSHHPFGMAMMGGDKKNSVVDPHCRSHDHKNLFIVGMAVFPSCGMSSPSLTIAALAIRAAEEIALQLKDKG